MDKKSMVFIVAALAAAFLIGASTNSVPDEIPDVIKAKRFVLVDNYGKEMLVLANTKYGGVITAFDKNGHGVVEISNGENGGAINVRNKTGESIVRLHADEDGNGLVGAYNRKGEGRTLQPGP